MTADGGPRAWRWPSLDESSLPARDFRPAGAFDGQVGQAEAEEAERLVSEGRERARRLIEAAQDQAEQIRVEARDEALAEAIERARERLGAMLEEAVAEQRAAFASAQEALLAEIAQAADERLEEIERELVGVVAMMAEKVIRRKVEADDSVVLDVVRATIEQAAGADRFVVRVASPDEERAREALAELISLAGGAEEMEIVADEAIGAGGCIVETERGRFDARLETQMELLNEEIGRVTGGGEQQ